MTLLDELVNTQRVITRQAFIAGQPCKPLSIDIDLGFDAQSSQATVALKERPEGFEVKQELEIWLGWSGYSIITFKGTIEDDDRRWFPFTNTIKAAGPRKKTQFKQPNAVSYATQKDVAIIEDLLTRAGVPNFSVEGENTTDFGVVQPIILRAGAAPAEIIDELDQVLGYKTFDGTDGFVYRRAVSGIPSSTAAFDFIEGVNTLEVSRPQSIRGTHNQAMVYGLPQDGIQWPTTREAISEFVDDPPLYIPVELRSSFIETEVLADAVAMRLMQEQNGKSDEITLKCWGNPYLQPVMTVSVTSARLGLASATNYFVRHIHHHASENEFITTLNLVRMAGAIGELTGKAPQARFVYKISKETYEITGTPTTVYTVTADASSSFDVDSPPDTLTYAWSNNKNADTGTGKLYVTNFTQAQMDAATKPTITLVVNDADPDSPSGTVTKTISITADPINVRKLWSAASLRGEATPDGGLTWNAYTPGAGTITAVPPISSSSYGLLGASDGKLYYSADYLLTTPTLAHTFPSQVNCIWVNEVDPKRVTVGCADGTVWLTVNMNLIASSTWVQLVDFASPVLDIQESYTAQGQYRVTMGEQELLTFDAFGSNGVIGTFSGGTARQIATSPFANYVSASHADEVKREDGTPITGISNSDVRALAHHPKEDKLYAVNLAGQSYEKAAGGTVFTAKAAIGSAGANHMINDGDEPLKYYVAHDDGLYKTFDAFTSIVRMRDYTGAGLAGLKVGRASLSLVNTLVKAGRRVFIAGEDASGTRFGWTDDILSASPSWTANNSGLPGGTVKLMRTYPFDPSNNLVLVVGDTVYRNTNARGGGTWTAIYTPVAGATIRDISFTIADPGAFYVYHNNGAAADDTYLSHTHDYTAGSPSFTSVQVSTQSLNGNIAVGQWNKDLVWVDAPDGSNPDSIWKSPDHGHNWAQHFTANNESLGIWLPYEGNSSELEIHEMNNEGGANIYRSVNGGPLFTLWKATPPSGTRLIFAPNDSDFVWTWDGDDFYKSEDRGLNWATYANVLSLGITGSLRDAANFNKLRFYYCAVLGSGSTSTEVGISEDLQNWTNKNGNLLTAVFTGAGPSPREIEVDFSS